MYNSFILCKPKRFHFFSSIFIIIFSLLLIIMFSPITGGAAGKSFAEDNITYTQRIVHKHTGNTSGGGCYGKEEVKTKTVYESCKGHMVYYPEWDKTQCDYCGASYDGDQSYRECWTTFPKQVKETVHQLSCGYAENQELGTYSVVQNTSDWANEITLSMNLSSSVFPEGSLAYSVNGSTIEGNIFPVSENGTYTVNIVQSPNISSSPITVTISNIDNSAPDFCVDYDSTPDIPSVTVKVTASDNSDGSGLDPLPYSFDGGNTWTDNPEYSLTENTILEIVVRDIAGNESEESVEITNIKKPVPPAPSSGAESNGNRENAEQQDIDSSDNGYEDYIDEGSYSTEIVPIQQEIPVAVPTPSPQKKASTVSAEENIVKKEPPVTVRVTSPALKTNSQPTDKKEIKKETNTIPPAVKSSPVQETQNHKDNFDATKALLTCLGILGLCGLSAILILYLNRISLIYNMKEQDKYVFRGFSSLSKRDGICEINISQTLFEKCDTGKLLIKLPPLFAVSHKGKDLVVYLPDKQSYTISVCHKVFLSVRV